MAFSHTLCRSLWVCVFAICRISDFNTLLNRMYRQVLAIKWLSLSVRVCVCVSCYFMESSNCEWWHFKCKGLCVSGCSGISHSINWWKLNRSIDDMDVTIVKLTLTQIYAGWHKRTLILSLARSHIFIIPTKMKCLCQCP